MPLEKEKNREEGAEIPFFTLVYYFRSHLRFYEVHLRVAFECHRNKH